MDATREVLQGSKPWTILGYTEGGARTNGGTWPDTVHYIVEGNSRPYSMELHGELNGERPGQGDTVYPLLVAYARPGAKWTNRKTGTEREGLLFDHVFAGGVAVAAKRAA
jgi:hypothetical protein